MRLATFNVNGIRAATRRGIGDWLAAAQPDVLCLQEVRAPDSLIPAGLFDGWHVSHVEGDRVGRNGVAVLSRSAPVAIRTGFGCPEFDATGRWIEVDLDGERPLTVVSVYAPKGESGTPLQEAKHRFLQAMTARLTVLSGIAGAGGRQAVVAGDLNVAAEEADVRAWKANLKHSGFLPEERDWLRGLTAGGLVDLVRAAHPDVAGPYSWWSWRGKAFDTDAGWRIDVLLATPRLAARLAAAWVDRAPTYAERISDHAPVLADLDL